MELEDVLNHVTGPMRKKLADVMRDMGLERGTFQSWRRSSDPNRKRELAVKIMEMYPEAFQDESVWAKTETTPTTKYTETLERFVAQLQRENDLLRKQNEDLWKRVFSE